MMTNNTNLQNRGSAIILALVIVSLVSVVAFSLSRVLVSEIKIESGLEDASGAYLVAEASLEDGLIEYRKNHNYQCSADYAPSPKACNDITNSAQNEPFRDAKGAMFNDKPKEIALTALNIAPSGNAVSSGIVWWNAVSPSAKPDEAVAPDDSVERDMSGLAMNIAGLTSPVVQNNTNCGASASANYAGAITFCWNWKDSAAAKGMFIDVIDTNGLASPPCATTGATQTVLSCPMPASPKTLRFHPLGSGLAAKETNLLCPVAYCFNTFKQPMDTGTTTIDALGQFGRSQRKLQVQLDRNRDALVSEFDFAVFSGSSL
ncbi:hypothetical protein HY065_01030 [Candidatus Berkelbacteria bacterium]|nr:hypothetical protein [Candidatus Berkelbacteria bacterium]